MSSIEIEAGGTYQVHILDYSATLTRTGVHSTGTFGNQTRVIAIAGRPETVTVKLLIKGHATARNLARDVASQRWTVIRPSSPDMMAYGFRATKPAAIDFVTARWAEITIEGVRSWT